MSLEEAEAAFRHAATQADDDAIAVLADGLAQMSEGLQEELAKLHAAIANLNKKA